MIRETKRRAIQIGSVPGLWPIRRSRSQTNAVVASSSGFGLVCTAARVDVPARSANAVRFLSTQEDRRTDESPYPARSRQKRKTPPEAG